MLNNDSLTLSAVGRVTAAPLGVFSRAPRAEPVITRIKFTPNTLNAFILPYFSQIVNYYIFFNAL